MNSLADALDDIRQAGDAKRPQEVTAVMKRATADLAASGILDGTRTVGQAAPFFARPNQNSEMVRLSSLLKSGPVVLSFFRGRW